MAKKQVHFMLDPAIPYENEVIQILENLPSRGVKAYICMLIKSSGGSVPILQAVNTNPIAVDTGTPPKQKKPKSNVPIANEQLDGQLSADDVLADDEYKADTTIEIDSDISNIEIPDSYLSEFMAFNDDD